MTDLLRLARHALLGGGLAALAFTGPGCDERVRVENLPPTVQWAGWCTLEGRTYVAAWIHDFESDPVDLLLCADGAAVATGAAGDGLIGLSSDGTEPGVLHLIEWAPRADDARCTCPLPRATATTTCAAPPSDGEQPTIRYFAQDGERGIAPEETELMPLDACP